MCNCNIELSDKKQNCITLRPGRLLCLRCLNGGGCLSFMEEEFLSEVLKTVKENPETHIKLETSFDEMGARTEKFYKQNIVERKRDLDVLQIIGLCPGDVRIARDLFDVIDKRINDVSQICGYGGKSTEKWPTCPLANTDCFLKGKEGINKLKDKEKMKYWKEISCNEIKKADRIVIRAHHLLCMMCYISRDDFKDGYEPLLEDNLFEVWMKMKENPDIPVTLIEGPGDCMICPPCYGFDNDRKLCFVGCHLRDRKKDADTFQKLDMLPGETLPAKEIIRRVSDRIPDNKGICNFEFESAHQWKSCNAPERYKKGLDRGFF